MKECAECGGAFEPLTPNNIICSDACRRARQVAANRAWRQRPESWAVRKLWSIRERSEPKGIEVTIEPSDIVPPEVCPIFGEPFIYDGQHPMNPSVDRINPDLGYVPGNVVVISNRANMIKQDVKDPEVFRKLADWLESVR